MGIPNGKQIIIGYMTLKSKEDSKRVMPVNQEIFHSVKSLSKLLWVDGFNITSHIFNEWRARLLMEQSSAIKCPSISYHLAGTKKIQQELVKPNVLERFIDNNIAKLRKCFAGLWSLDDSDIVKDAIERPGLYVMKPQRKGGGNNIYGNDVKEALMRLQKEGSEADAAYILMQRIFPTVSRTFLMRNGICYKDDTVSELGIYGAYLRNKEKVILSDQCGYLMRTKAASSDESGVALLWVQSGTNK
ncbi:hypothetical protein ACE6H2_022285 [Prunus campanulata]